MELLFFSIMGDCVCKIVCQFFGMGSVYFWLCLFLGWCLFVLVFFLVVGVMFGVGFVCLWVGKYVIMPFNSREGVSVGLFNYRF